MKDKNNSFDQILNFGFGLFSATKETVENFVDDMVKKGEVSREEASHLVDDLLKKGEKQKESLSEEIDQMIQKKLHYFVTKDQVVEIVREELKKARVEIEEVVEEEEVERE